MLCFHTEKMYRQVWVSDEDCSFQRILWRSQPEQPIKEYKLKTVTYGTTMASFLATRCLKKLAEENKISCPNAYKAIINDFYMDDYLGGANTILAAIKLRNEIINVLNSWF